MLHRRLRSVWEQHFPGSVQSQNILFPIYKNNYFIVCSGPFQNYNFKSLHFCKQMTFRRLQEESAKEKSCFLPPSLWHLESQVAVITSFANNFNSSDHVVLSIPLVDFLRLLPASSQCSSLLPLSDEPLMDTQFSLGLGHPEISKRAHLHASCIGSLFHCTPDTQFFTHRTLKRKK